MKISILIPTLNEGKTIGSVIENIKTLKKNSLNSVYIIDANSTDKTTEIANKLGVRILSQKNRGKGNALRQAFSQINSDAYVIIDGDDTYDSKEIPKLIKPIISEEADLVIGSRTIHRGRKNITFLNLLGNFLLNFTLRIFLRKKITDTLSGFRVFNKELLKKIKLVSKGFEVETEMTVKALKGGYRVKEIPVSYKKRITPPKLSPLKDGFKISLALIRFLIQ